MPREIVHWAVLEEVTRRLPPGPLLDYIRADLAAAKLGAVLHDAPYYLRGGGQPWEIVAEVLHGRKGSDTYEPFRILAQGIQACPEPQQPLLWALFAGLVTHAAADIVFHPLVFYFTGDYYDENAQQRSLSRANHRLFEVWLDSWAANKYYGGQRAKIWALLTSLKGSKLIDISSLLGTTWDPATLGHPEVSCANAGQRWTESIYWIALTQFVFTESWGGISADILNRLLTGRLQGITALSSRDREATLDFFCTSVAFKNPVTGAATTATCEDLFEQAVALSLSLLGPLALQREKPLSSSPLGDTQGPSLSTGVVGTHQLKYFDRLSVPWLY